MTIKEMKRDFLVIWIEFGMQHTRWYYRQRDAENMAYALIHKDGIPSTDVQVIDTRAQS